MFDKKYYRYAEDVISGKIVAGIYIHLLCRKYLDWLNGLHDDIVFFPDRVEKVVRFISKLTHLTGKQFIGKPFLLQDWLFWIVCYIFGFYYLSTNQRVVRDAYILISRKCGKTSFAAALALYGMIADNEPGAEIDIVAPSRELSGICYSSCDSYLRGINRGKIFKTLRKRLLFPAKNSFIRVMSSDAKFGDGFNTHFGILDEFHAFNNNAIPDLLTSSMGMRLNPLLIYITTAGFNLNGPCKRYRDMCIEILYGKKTDDRVFAAIYEMDAEDLWDDESKWKKCCPSLGVTVNLSYIKDLVTKAKNNPINLTGVLTKTLNMWVLSRSIWIPNDYVVKCLDSVDLTDFNKEKCFGGVDLGAVSDLTSFTVVFPPNKKREKWPDKYVFKTWFFAPEIVYDESNNSELYREWARRGDLIITPGKTTDYDYMLKVLIDVKRLCFLSYIGYDSWLSLAWSTEALKQGLYIYPYSQSIGHFSSPTKYLEILIRNLQCVIDNNSIIKFCFLNVELKTDWNDNIKPVKSQGDLDRKIDGVITMIEALGVYLENSGNSGGSISIVSKSN